MPNRDLLDGNTVSDRSPVFTALYLVIRKEDWAKRLASHELVASMQRCAPLFSCCFSG